MSQTQLSLAWKTFQSNICDGLSSFQQREEFVDMTLAADGHFVKVHKMVISLASPYLKELIKSAPCPHPILFLNQVSHRILCGILEYIYSGEVVVNKDDIGELIQAGKALHIKGLEEMDWSNVQIVEDTGDPVIQSTHAADVKLISPAGNLLRKRKSENDFPPQPLKTGRTSASHDFMSRRQVSETEIRASNVNVGDDDFMGDSFQNRFDDHSDNDDKIFVKSTTDPTNVSTKPTIQYTLSNQGHMQMILNRYMYGLTYNYKNSTGTRLWKCVDSKNIKCPASVTTKDNIVVQRVGAHTHAFHDKKILKKVNADLVFSAIRDAENQGKSIKNKES